MTPSQRTTKPIRVVLSILWKDLVSELRSRELLPALLVFSLLVVILFNFAIELSPDLRLVITPGILWVTFIFAGNLGLNRSIAAEKELGCMDSLLLSPIDRSAIFFGKVLGNLFFLMCIEIIILPIYSLLYNLNLFHPSLLLIFLLGSIGYAAVGTLLSVMAVQTRLRDLLLPILFFPVILPLLMAAVKACDAVLQGQGVSNASSWLNLLVAYDLIFLAVGYMVFDFVVAE